jgi:2-polyprenyl-3-methyl-5-hydroxy-6-metoxy-1,4-benzoquinol methylase
MQPSIRDSAAELDERQWWDLWNTSYRALDNFDEISNELFTRTAAVVNEITRGRPSRVLEVGCGTGTLSRMLEFTAYHGLDISPAAIAIAKETSQRIPAPDVASIAVYEAVDFHEWAAPPESFDVVVCVDAVAYFRDQRFSLAKMAKSLRNAGVLVLTTINPFVYHRIRRTTKSPLREGSVSRWLTRGELHALICSAGLTIQRSGTIMPRGNRGILRVLNARRLNEAFGPGAAASLRRMKEKVGLGQYRLVVARKESTVRS